MSPEAQLRQRRLGRLRALCRLWLAGVAVFAVSIAVAALLHQLGFFVVAIIAAVLCGLTLLPIGFLVGSSREDHRRDVGGGALGAVTLIGALIAVAVSLVGQDEVVLFGGTARDVVAAQAAESGAAFVHFRQARVRADMVERVPVYAGSQRAGSYVAYYLRVAPIVDADWTPARPIAAFAVLGSPSFGHRNEEWRRPFNAGIRANGANAAERERALQAFRADPELRVDANPVFLRWSADPEGEARAAWLRLLNALLIATAIWTVMVIVVRGGPAFVGD